MAEQAYPNSAFWRSGIAPEVIECRRAMFETYEAPEPDTETQTEFARRRPMPLGMGYVARAAAEGRGVEKLFADLGPVPGYRTVAVALDCSESKIKRLLARGRELEGAELATVAKIEERIDRRLDEHHALLRRVEQAVGEVAWAVLRATGDPTLASSVVCGLIESARVRDAA
jgi:hypothetical protein